MGLAYLEHILGEVELLYSAYMSMNCVLALSASECDLFWKEGHSRFNQMKMRSLGGPQFNITSVFIKRKIWTQRPVQRRML